MNKENLVKSYNLITPEGEEIQVTNLAQFCRDNDLNYGCMLAVKDPNKILKSHRGYRIV